MRKKSGFKKISFLAIILLIIFCGIIFIISTDVKYSFSKSELGHIFSIVLNLNDFEINVLSSEKNNYKIFWNEIVIYENGKIIRKNFNDARYIYGDNEIVVKSNGFYKQFDFYKFNNWEYHKFKINIYDNDALLWIDNKFQK